MNLNNHSIPGRITTLALILVSSIYAQTLGPSESEVSLQGSRLNYYPRPALAQCQADCVNNPNCKGFTWINAGTYQPSDPAMCYLMSAVTGRSPARGHISGVKQVSAGTGGAGTTPMLVKGDWTFKCCDDTGNQHLVIATQTGATFTGSFEGSSGRRARRPRPGCRSYPGRNRHHAGGAVLELGWG